MSTTYSSEAKAKVASVSTSSMYSIELRGNCLGRFASHAKCDVLHCSPRLLIHQLTSSKFRKTKAAIFQKVTRRLRLYTYVVAPNAALHQPVNAYLAWRTNCQEKCAMCNRRNMKGKRPEVTVHFLRTWVRHIHRQRETLSGKQKQKLLTSGSFSKRLVNKRALWKSRKTACVGAEIA